MKFKFDLRKQLKNEELEKEILDKTKELKLDFNNKKFIYEKEYERFKNEFKIDLPVIGRVSWDYYIEKIMIPQENINEIKMGSFDINTNKKILKDNISIKGLAKEIIKEEGMVGLPNEKENMRQNLYEIKFKLEKLDIYIFKFGKRNIQSLKLIKLLYMFEKKEGINIIQLLKNATLENVDNSCIGVYTKNGSDISKFKYEIMKEIEPNFIFNSNSQIRAIIHTWTQILECLKMHLINSFFYDSSNELNRILNFVQDVYKKINLNLNTNYKHNVFETVYLYIIKNENIGREKDILSIQEKISQEIKDNNKLPGEEYVSRYKELANVRILKENIEKYIDENLEEVTRLVLMQESITEDDERYIKSIVKYINPLLDIIESGTTCLHEKGLSITFVISCLQEILISKDTREKYTASYFKSDCKPKTLFSILKNPSKYEEIYKILWIKKVDTKFYCNLGLYGQLMLFNQIEKTVDDIIVKILSLNSLSDIKIVNELLSDLISTTLVSDDVALKNAEEFATVLNGKINYKVCIKTHNALNFFKVGLNGEMLLELIDNISSYVDKMIKDYVLERSYQIPIEFNEKEYSLIVRIKNNYKIIDFTYFVGINSDETAERLEEIGLKEFIGDNIVQERIYENL